MNFRSVFMAAVGMTLATGCQLPPSIEQSLQAQLGRIGQPVTPTARQELPEERGESAIPICDVRFSSEGSVNAQSGEHYSLVPSSPLGRLSIDTELFAQPNGQPLGNGLKDDAVTVVHWSVDDRCIAWYQVRINSTTGWVQLQSVTLDDEIKHF